MERPWWAKAAPYAAGGGGLAYGALRTYGMVGHHPDLPPTGDLGVLSGWGAIALCAAAVVLAPLVAAAPYARFAAAARALAIAVGLGCAVASVLIVIDVVGLLFPGIGFPLSAAALASRACCLTIGAALTLTAVTARRTARGACASCGRTAAHAEAHGPAPRWAMVGAYVAVAGCAVRFAAQAAIGFGTVPVGHAGLGSAIAAVAFAVAMLLAGTLLPLALVHRWGRIFPRWTLFLAGRRVPRPLLAVPACFVSGGLLTYFGTGTAQIVTAMVTGGPFTAPGLPAAFLVSAVGGYLVWGIGLAVATVAYLARTRPVCRRCGRGGAADAVDSASRAPRAALL